MSDKTGLSWGDDKGLLALSVFAIAVFAGIAGMILISAGDDDSEAADAPISTTSTTATIESTTSTTSTTALPTTTTTEPAEIPVVNPNALTHQFGTATGLGFTRDRTWSFDPDTGILTNSLVFRALGDGVGFEYVEVIPALLLGSVTPEFDDAVDFKPDPDGPDGSARFRLTVLVGPDVPTTVVWSIPIANPDRFDLAALDAFSTERDRSEALFLGFDDPADIYD